MRRTNAIVAILAVLESAAFVVGLRGLGFPDGHRTELERFQGTTYPFVVMLAALALAAASGRAKPRSTWLALAAVTVLAGAVEGTARVVLDHGGGG